MRRVCLLLSCWTLLYLGPVLGSSSRTGTSEQQPRRQLEAPTGEAEGDPARRSGGARIRAAPPLITGESTRRAPPSAWQQLRVRATGLGARPCTPGGDRHVPATTADTGAETGAGRGGSAHGSAGAAAAAALRRHVTLRGGATRHGRPLVIPHDYMLSLFWTLSTGNGSADTVTSLVDAGRGEARARARLTFLPSF